MRLWIPALSLLFALSVESPMRADGVPFSDDAAARKAARTWYRAQLPVTIYGKVIDLESNTVEGASVQIFLHDTIGFWDPGRVLSVTSDKNGLWAFRARIARFIGLSSASHREYEYLPSNNEYHDLIRLQTTKTNPVIVRMRKRVDMTFLYRGAGDKQLYVTSPANGEKMISVIARPESYYVPDSYTDLVLSAWFVPGTNKWAIRYSATNGSDGLVLSTNFLYQAPNGGYEKEVVWQGPPWPKYLYLRSRSPAIYSRLEFSGDSNREIEALHENLWVYSGGIGRSPRA